MTDPENMPVDAPADDPNTVLPTEDNDPESLAGGPVDFDENAADGDQPAPDSGEQAPGA